MMHDSQIKGDELFQRQRNRTRFNAPTIICDGLQTPDNLGSILRVADAAGSNNIILLDSDLDLHSKKISKIARSANKNIAVNKISLQQFTEFQNPFKHIVALEITQQSTNIFNSNILSCDAIVLGHESSGIRKDTLALCNAAVHLPMFGINGSMNISHALTVFLYEWRRQEISP